MVRASLPTWSVGAANATADETAGAATVVTRVVVVVTTADVMSGAGKGAPALD